MFKNLSIQKKMNYFTLMVTVSVFSAAIFIFLAMSHIETKYNHLHHNSMISGLTTLQIEKKLNYISRTSRDIILGGNYDKNIKKLKNRIEDIRSHFHTLEKLMAEDKSIQLVIDAKSSTMIFLDDSYAMMQSITLDDIQNNKVKVYKRYKNDLTPLANKSRESFKKLVSLKENELKNDSRFLGMKLNFLNT